MAACHFDAAEPHLKVTIASCPPVRCSALQSQDPHKCYVTAPSVDSNHALCQSQVELYYFRVTTDTFPLVAIVPLQVEVLVA